MNFGSSITEPNKVPRTFKSKRQAHFTCGASRTEAEHHQPRFGEVNDTRWSQEGDVPARLRIIKEGFSTALFGFWLNDSAFRPFLGVRAICLKP